MISQNEFNWTLYITYYVIDVKTKKRKSTIKTIRLILDSKQTCIDRLSAFNTDYREVVGHTILDHLKGLALYIADL